MNFIDKSASFLATSIRNNYAEAGSQIALQYSLSLIINSFISITTILIISLLTGNFLNAILTVSIFSFLRYITGGAHMNTSVACCISSIIILTCIIHVKFESSFITLVLTTISIIIVFIKAPQGIKNISRVDEKYYPLLKLLSIVTIASNYIFLSSLFSLIIITQAFFLTNTSYKLINYLDGSSKNETIIS